MILMGPFQIRKFYDTYSSSSMEITPWEPHSTADTYSLQDRGCRMPAALQGRSQALGAHLSRERPSPTCHHTATREGSTTFHLRQEWRKTHPSLALNALHDSETCLAAGSSSPYDSAMGTAHKETFPETAPGKVPDPKGSGNLQKSVMHREQLHGSRPHD